MRKPLCAPFAGWTGLVALAVISAICSVAATPALPKNPEEAICQDHLRQLYTSWIMYVLDHEGQVPPATRLEPVGSTTRTVGWTTTLGRYLGFFPGWTGTSWTLNGHLDTPLSCPADRHEHGFTVHGFGPEHYLSYAYNSRVAPTLFGGSNTLAQIAPKTIVFGDNRNNWHFNSRPGLGFRHDNLANAVLADGSIHRVRGDDPDDPPSWMWFPTSTEGGPAGDVVWIADLLVEPGRTIAVGGSGSLLSREAGSPDWTRQVHGGDRYHWNGLARGNGVYVAVGAERQTLHSVDGITWTASSTGESGGLSAVHFALGYFWAAGDGVNQIDERMRIWRSDDGTGWEKILMPEAGRLRAIGSGQGRLVAVGSQGARDSFSRPAALWSSEDGSAWTLRLSGPEGILRDVTHGGERFVAVGGGGLIYVSNDGIDWERAPLASPSALQAVAYGNGRFLVTGGIGDRQVAFTSADGFDWQPAAPPPGFGLLRLVFDGERFVGAGTYRTIVSTADGSEWRVESQGAHSPLFGIAGNAGLAVAAGASAQMLESDDGETWTDRPGGTGRWWWDVVDADGTFYAVGRHGALQRRVEGNWEPVKERAPLADFTEFHVIDKSALLVNRDRLLWHSADGSEWEVAVPVWGERLRKLAVANGLAVAIGDSETFAVSADGVVWTPHTWTEAPLVRDLHYADGHWWAVTFHGQIHRSPDLQDWEVMYAQADDPLDSIAHAGGKLYAHGSKLVDSVRQSYVVVSTDGTSWSHHTLPEPIAELTGIQDRLVAVCGMSIVSSDDGLVWQERLSFDRIPRLSVSDGGERVYAGDIFRFYGSSDGLDWEEVAAPTTLSLHAAGTFQGASYLAGRRGLILRSFDGVQWERISSGEEMRAIAHDGGTFVAVGENGVAMISDDGETWNWRDTGATYWRDENGGEPLPERASLSSVVAVDGTFVAAGQEGVVVRSEGGGEWAQVEPGVAGQLRSLAAGGGGFVGVGDDGLILVSSDGLAWEQAASPVLTDWRAVAHANGEWIVLGQQGDAASSPDGLTWTRITIDEEILFNAAAFFADDCLGVGAAGEIRTIAAEPVVAGMYDVWRDRLFAWHERRDAEISGPAADPDGLGLPNLLRWAFAFRTRGWEQDHLPAIRSKPLNGEGGAGENLVVTYVRPRGVEGYLYGLEGSGDLVAWEPVEAELLEVVPLDDERERVTLRESGAAPGSPDKRFLRVRVQGVEP